jgi:pyruvate/2-oxoglutarate dehydrogenase complex dihydrolipoamide dehydrogenase (E3) component/uncharacterized membrane protein YdjX (TVP38/TMEM64 family)
VKKILLAVAFLAAIALFFAFDLNQYLTLEGLRGRMDALAAFRNESPVQLALYFLIAYILVTALSLPGAAIMTLASGAIFGIVEGTILASIASSIGATLAFLMARFVLGDSIQKRFGSQLKTINEGVAKDGMFYLLTLRLVPAFPFFVINLLMALTAIRTWTFYWVSQIGMLPGTIVYVNAGTQLASLKSMSGILSPKLIFSFVLLGIFPLIAKAISDYIARRRVYANWTRPESFDRNMIVIGAGSAGLVSAYIAATVKAKVTLIEAHKMGGDCLNYGCVPSKALIKSSKVAHQMAHADKYGLAPTAPSFSFKAVMQRVQTAIATIEPHDSIERYTKLGVEVRQGYATLIDPWTVDITAHDGSRSRLTARSIVIATGAEPFVPPLPNLAEAGYVTSDTVWSEFAKLDQPPGRLVVLGGGPIGCELAQAFARLGSQVTQVEMAPRLLLREDPEIAELAEQSLRNDGVYVLTGHRAVRVHLEADRKVLVVEREGKEYGVEFDALLCAVGRSARLKGYGLETLGIPTDRTITSNAYLETIYPNIYVAGDVAGPYQFTHVASHQAWYAAVNGLFGHLRKFKADYSVIPWATFVDPEIARVGLNETDAKEKGIPYEVTRYEMHELDRAIVESATEGFIKVLTVPGKDKILGVTIVGEHAAELLSEYVFAMRHGLGLKKIMGTIHMYPTMSELNKYAAGEWRRNHAPQKLLAWVGRYHEWRLGKGTPAPWMDSKSEARQAPN